MSNSWSNWSGFVRAEPKLIASPADAGKSCADGHAFDTGNRL